MFLNRLSLLIFIIYCIEMNRGQIYWDLRQPVVFGQVVQLFCNASGIENCCITETRRWNGGPQQRTVTRNEVSFNTLKYVPIRETDGFSLLIKHFSVTDVNIRYTCSYGRQQYENVLKMDSGFTKYPKDIQTISFKNTETEIFLQVKLKEVYPIPHCSVTLNKKKLNTSLLITSTATSIFYDTTVVLEDSLTVECGMLVMDCTVGQKVYTAVKNITDNCKDNDETFNPARKQNYKLSIALVVVGIFVLILVVIVIVISRRTTFIKCTTKKSRSANHAKENEKETKPLSNQTNNNKQTNVI